MGLFKEVKKPVIKHSVAGSADVSSLRPAYVAKTAPCIHSCPSGTDVRGWLVALAQHQAYGRTPAQAFELAWRTILENNPFPAICGRVCQHPCELNCNRKAKDGAAGQSSLEQFVGDFAIAHGLRAEKPSRRQRSRRAHCRCGRRAGRALLRRIIWHAKAIAVTLIDAAPRPGGMMRYRIPRAVIPAEILDAEIANILDLGIELRAGCVVGRDAFAGRIAAEIIMPCFLPWVCRKPRNWNCARARRRGGTRWASCPRSRRRFRPKKPLKLSPEC